MSEQTINKGIMIAGGLLGLGILGYLFFREKEEFVEEAEFTIVEEPKPKQARPAPAVVYKKPKVEEKPEKEVIVKQPLPTVNAQKQVETKKEVVSKPNDDFPLQLGSKGKRVEQLQVYLLRNHGSAGIVTDDFNKRTEERVQKYLKVETVSESLFSKLNMDGSNKKKNNGTKAKY